MAQLKHQLATLSKYGAQVTVITSKAPELGLLDALEGVTCVPITISRSISLWRDMLALFKLYRFFKRERTQIAHSTTPKAGLLTALAAFFAGVPIRLHTFTGQPWTNMRGIQRWLLCSSDKLVGRLNTRCYADSQSQRQFLIAQGIVDARRLFVIGSGSLAGVEVQRFDRNRFSSSQCKSMRQLLGIPEVAPVLLFMGRITVDKGVRELLQAFNIIKAGESDAHLVFLGRFDSESGIAGMILPSDILCLPDSHIVSYTENPEEYLAIADILCLPSHREGFGTVVIEAAAMGVPTIGTNIYGLSDAVVHGETGILVSPYNVNELVSALELLLTDQQVRRRMGEAAKKRALALFDASRVNMQLTNEYCALLEAKRILQ